MIAKYRTQKILLTGNIDDESHAYLLWCCEQSNSLYNCTLFHIRQAHFNQCGHRYFFDQYDQYRIIAKYKKGKSNFYWDKTLDEITHKRNFQMRDAINKAARFVINYCLANGIGNIVFGWNEGNKKEINLSRASAS